MSDQKIVSIHAGELYPGQGGKIVIEFRLSPGADYLVPYPNSWELKKEGSALTTFPDTTEGVISKEKSVLIPFIRPLSDHLIGDHVEVISAEVSICEGTSGQVTHKEQVDFHIHFVLKNDEKKSGISKDPLNIHFIHKWI